MGGLAPAAAGGLLLGASRWGDRLCPAAGGGRIATGGAAPRRGGRGRGGGPDTPRRRCAAGVEAVARSRACWNPAKPLAVLAGLPGRANARTAAQTDHPTATAADPSPPATLRAAVGAASSSAHRTAG